MATLSSLRHRFSGRRGTALYRLRTPAAKVALVLLAVNFGKIPNYLDVLVRRIVKRETSLLPFVIEWDLGEVVPEAYRHRFSAIYRIAQQCDSSTFPVWVMVTTNRLRAAQLI